MPWLIHSSTLLGDIHFIYFENGGHSLQTQTPRLLLENSFCSFTHDFSQSRKIWRLYDRNSTVNLLVCSIILGVCVSVCVCVLTLWTCLWVHRLKEDTVYPALSFFADSFETRGNLKLGWCPENTSCPLDLFQLVLGLQIQTELCLAF